MAKDVIIALDFKNKAEALAFLDLFGEKRPFVKVGMELFYAEGPSIVSELKARGHKVFLDLKSHDIPNTVKQAMAVLSKLGADICDVHAGGTTAMMQAATEGLTREDGSRPLLIAITQLTSTSEERMHGDLLIDEDKSMEEVVAHYALNAKLAGLDGVVCSPLEVPVVKNACGQSFLTVTPGIRLEGGDVGDQIRITTPKKAREIGSDYIVVGRPITKAINPIAAYERCVKEFLED